MKIGYLGAGIWGFSLAALLSGKGYDVVSWTVEKDIVDTLNEKREHPKLPGSYAEGNIVFTTDLQKALEGVDMVVESVTSSGVRVVFEQVKKLGISGCPIVLTSKGIEQGSGLILSEVVEEVLGEGIKEFLCCLSGPSFASEVVYKLPTSVVCSSYEHTSMMAATEAFTAPAFRVYPNSDMKGVSLCGALKNVIAIACGVTDGLGLGQSCKAALMTRGLHEIAKLAVAQGCRLETVYGLAGMGDLCLTCSSTVSRNYHFGSLLAQGMTAEDAKEKIGMVVEGAYTAVSALELSKKMQVPMPITESVHAIIYGGLDPKKAVIALMKRAVKEEHL